MIGPGVYGNTAYPFGDGGFEAFVTVPRPANFYGQTGWWSVPQQWYTITDAVGQIWVSPKPFPSSATMQQSVTIAVSLDLPLSPSPPSTVLVTSSQPHGFPIGDATYYVANPTPVTISGAVHSYFNGTFFITGVSDTTHFTYSVIQSGVDEIFDAGSISILATVPSPQPIPRFAAKINMDGTLVFIDTLANLRSGNSNPFSRF